MKKKDRNNRRRSLVFILGAILWLSVIFLFSSEPNLRSSFPYNVDLVLRKIAHIIEYFILTVLLYKALQPSLKKHLLVGVVLLALGWAIFDEWHQLFVAGREGALRDVLFDAGGIFIARYFIIRKTKK